MTLPRSIRRIWDHLQGCDLPIPPLHDRIRIVWTWRRVRLCDHDTFIVTNGQSKRGFVIERTGTFLTGPCYFAPQYLRRFRHLLTHP